MAESPLQSRWLGRLLPGWSRERLFLPALTDRIQEHRSSGRPAFLLGLSALGLWFQCLRISAQEQIRAWRGRSSLAVRDLPRIRTRHVHRIALGTRESVTEQAAQDVRFAVRGMLSRPGFSLTLIAILALGIGANTMIFTLLDKVVLRPLAFPDPQALVHITETNRDDGAETLASVTAGSFTEWRERARLLDGIAAISGTSFDRRVEDGVVPMRGMVVSGGFFEVLGVPPALGRGFGPLAERTEGEAVISYRDWQSRFAGAADAVGAELILDGNSYRIVGIAGPEFTFGTDVDVWVAADNDIPRPPVPGEGDYTTDFSIGYLQTVARISAGTSLDQAREEMEAISAAISEEQPENQGDRGVRVTPLHEYAVGGVRAPLAGLVAAVTFVLLIACANIASLLLARAGNRRREMAIRQAMGAVRHRLFRLLVVESLLVSLMGGVAGVVLAAVVGELVVGWLPDLPRTVDLSIDMRVLGFAFLVSAGCGLLFGTAPAWQTSRTELRGALGSTRATESGGARRVRAALVVAEIAMALVLAIGAGLLLKSFVKLTDADPGFDADGVVALTVALPDGRYDSGSTITFFNESLAGLRALPGAESVGLVLAMPFSGQAARVEVYVNGEGADATEELHTVLQTASSDYFRTMRIPLLAGRDFDGRDGLDGASVAIVNEEFVRRFLPSGADPLARTIHFGDGEPTQIIGISGDVRHYGYGEEVWPEVYAPVEQLAWPFATFMVRASGDPAQLTGPARAAIAAVDPPTGVRRVALLRDVLSGSVTQPRFITTLVGAFATSALLLAGLGVFGLIHFSVSQRVHEIGIRMALGADRGAMLALVMRQATGLLALGLVAGIGGGLALTRLLASQLYDVTPFDVSVYAVAAAVLAATALAAAWFPARRAARIEPAVALRAD